MRRVSLWRCLLASVTATFTVLSAAAVAGPIVQSGARLFGVSSGGGGGSPSALEWTDTVTGASKGPAAGYIVPVAMTDGTTTHGGRIFSKSAPGDIAACTERALGETGAISIDVDAFASTNTTAGVHFTATSATISYADGEIGWKCVTVPILSIPTGFGIVGIEFTGAAAYHRYSYIWLQGTGEVSGAKYLNSLGSGVESSANTSGDGSSGNPWRSPYYAAHQMTCGVLYVRNDGGNYRDTHNSASNEWKGAFQFANSCTVSNPLVVLPDPDNSGQPTFDNDVQPTDINTKGIIFGDNADSIWLVGLKVTRGNVTTNYDTTTNPSDLVIWKSDIGNFRLNNNSNTAAIRYDHTLRLLVQDCYLHEIYSTEHGSSNPFDSVPSGVHEGAEGFDGRNAAFVHNKFSVLQFGVFEKDAPTTSGFNSVDVSHNLFTKLDDASVSYQDAGGGSQPMFRGLVRYNAFEGGDQSGGSLSNVKFVYAPKNDSAVGQSIGLDVYHNVSRGAVKFLQAHQITSVRYWNNLVEDATDGQIVGGSANSGLATQFLWSDWNTYYDGANNWRLRYGGTTVNYNSLGAWQAATHADLATFMDVHSTKTTGTPSYTNAASYDYRITSGLTGRGGRYIGVGAERVGIVNP